jgi:demethylmenaquinone methyltransferase/2-methoxy-6-polyprenyl-1,4-benzoquinol methylase
MNKEDDVTHFGYQKVSTSEKAGKVAEVFHSVAKSYDLMNDVMSLGTHRVMKKMAANATQARTGHHILDLAGGTGDMALLLSQHVGADGRVYVCDINGSMLSQGRDKLLNRGIVTNVSYVQADGEKLPFPNASFNVITIAFGLRNFTAKESALREMYKVLKPGGKVVILEFSVPNNTLIKNAYKGFRKIWPKIGEIVTGDKSSYQYLVESIEMHPDQRTLTDMICNVGFDEVRHQNLLNGIAAIHQGVKPRLAPTA